MKRRFFPAALNVQGKPCLVIGEDAEAREKSSRLRDSGADVTDVAPASFKPEMILDQFLVVLTPKNDPALTRMVADRCRARRVLLSAIDQPAVSDVAQVSLVEAGHLQIAVSTDGHAPALAKRVREDLSAAFSAAPVAAFVDHLAELRRRLEKEIPDLAERRRRLIEAAAQFRLKVDVSLPDDFSKGAK